MKIPEQYRALYKAARRQGWEITRTAGQHLKWCSPAGETVHTPSTPGRRRSYLHQRAALRRAGLKV